MNRDNLVKWTCRFLRFFVVFGLAYYLLATLSNVARLSMSLDLTDLAKGPIIESKEFSIDLNQKILKSITDVDLPLLYIVKVENDVFVFLEATQPTTTPSTTTVSINNDLRVPYDEKRQLSAGSVLIKDEETAKNYLLNNIHSLQVTPDTTEKILLGPNADFRMRIDDNHKFIKFSFELAPIFQATVFLLIILAAYPVLLSACGIYRFIVLSEPFSVAKSATTSMKSYLNPKNFTPALGSYSHGIKVDVGNAEMIFVTGQIAMDKDGNAVAPGDFAKQTEFIFENIKKILAEGSATLEDVVKATIFITDISRFKEVSDVRNRYFATSKPASTLIEISKTVKDGCAVEIEVIAVIRK